MEMEDTSTCRENNNSTRDSIERCVTRNVVDKDTYLNDFDISLDIIDGHENILVVRDVINNSSVIQDLRKEILSLPFSLMHSDLFRFQQTDDFKSLNLPFITQRFYNLMATEVRQAVEKLFNIETKKEISITASLYKKGDFLLCHDDQSYDRAVAFVFYLSEDVFNEEDGGQLRFFKLSNDGQPINGKYRLVLKPKCNTLALFRVNKYSFHEVEEVMSNKRRLSINGWFLTPKPQHSSHSPFQKAVFTQPESETEIKQDVTEILKSSSVILLDGNESKVKENLKDELKENLSVVIEDFLQTDCVQNCVEELNQTKAWEGKGSALHRNYEAVDVEFQTTSEGTSKTVLPDPNLQTTSRLIDLFLCNTWLTFITSITGKEFAILDESQLHPMVSIEIQKWKEGSYSLFSDQDNTRHLSTIDVIVFLEVKQIVDNSDLDFTVQLIHIVNRDLHDSSYRNIKKYKYTKLLNEYKYQVNRKHKNEKNTSCVSKQYLAKSKTSEKIMRDFGWLIEDKINRIKEYRKMTRNLGEENRSLLPSSNSVAITLSNPQSSSFIPYIRHTTTLEERKKNGPSTRLYCVVIKYLTDIHQE